MSGPVPSTGEKGFAVSDVARVSRPAFLAAASAACCCAFPSAVQGTDALPLPFPIDASPTDFGRPVRESDAVYDGPLIDTHAHLNPPVSNFPAESVDILAAIRNARVDRIVLLPAPNEGRWRLAQATQVQRMDLVKNSGGRVLRMCGSEYLTDWMEDSAVANRMPSQNDIAGRIGQLNRDLASGTSAGIGEIGFLHFDTAGGQPVVHLPPEYPPFLAIAEAAATAGVWMDIHAEPIEPDGTQHYADVYATLAFMFQRWPNLRLIYSHNGLTNPRNAQSLLTTFPNIMMNTSFYRRAAWRHLGPLTNERGAIYEDWAELLEALPDRFMIGTDFLFGWTPAPLEAYANWINVDRRILGSLSPTTARKIAFDNAVRVFGPIATAKA